MLQVKSLLFNQLVKTYATIVSTPEVVNALKELGKERSLNQLQLIGRVGQDPKVGGNHEHGSTDKPTRVVMFSLATNEYNGQTGEGAQRTRVDWHRVAVSYSFHKEFLQSKFYREYLPLKLLPRSFKMKILPRNFSQNLNLDILLKFFS